MALAVAACCVLFAARCSQYKPFDSVGFLRAQYTKELGPDLAVRIDVPFAVDTELHAAYMKGIQPASELSPRVQQVLDFIFYRIKLSYSLTPTRNAGGTFRARKGNCLSFVNLFVGLARDQGLNPFYVEVTDYQKWNHRQGLVVSQGHIVAGMYLEGQLKTYDFLPFRLKAYRQFKPIDDQTAVAHYYNNMGAEALLDGDVEQADRLLTIASKVAPRFDKSLNNLGVCKARRGDFAAAVALYHSGLAIDPRNAMLMSNLARAYQETGRAAEAVALLVKIEETNTSNPFFYVYLGEMALAGGDTAKALDYMARALRLDGELPEVHLGLVKVYLALGELENARHYLARALKLDATDKEALRYAHLLGR
ncbi:MAG TPA: tetratricopeptide repeat protein [Thermoanaerobaculia bacterium]|nr:tetratricopeptide repeat protein [Thermoanaerobaculia bacterium]